MCGIVGILTNTDNCAISLMDGLKSLQNRGYDSAGICTFPYGEEFIVHKYASENVSALVKLESILHHHRESHVGIAHTRWATHGGKTDANSHPHISCDNMFAVVHNGIIENFTVLKAMLIEKGYTFSSQTDTEVVSNLLAYNFTQFGGDIVSTINETIRQMEGTWGLVIMCAQYPDHLFCTKNGSPILIGKTDDYVMAVSEQSGFNEDIKKYIVLNNYDVCTIKLIDNAIDIQTTHRYDLKPITLQFNAKTPAPYEHWTLKEIYEQKESIQRAISFGGRIVDMDSVKLGGLQSRKKDLLDIEHLILLGCGTSYNAGLLGVDFFKDLCDFNTIQIFDGAEFDISDVPKKGKTALILLSQSGETKDLHRCIGIAKKYDILTIGVVNMVDSLIAREVDCGCYLNAGKEVAVASTKSFTSQVIVLSMIAIWFSQNRHINRDKRVQYINDLYNLNNCISELFDDLEATVEKFVSLFGHTSCFILGKGKNEALAREASLKIKEISYIHSESYSSSSLKHGPFALLCDGFPVTMIMPGDEHFDKNMNAYHEVKSRNANILIVTDRGDKIDLGENVINVPYNRTYNNILSIIPLQMLAYKLSVKKGINPDMPKNLAKVVTVE